MIVFESAFCFSQILLTRNLKVACHFDMLNWVIHIVNNIVRYVANILY